MKNTVFIFFALTLGSLVSGCSTLEVRPGSQTETETADCLFRASLQEQLKGRLIFDVEIKNLSSASWPVGPNRILLSGAGVNQKVISANDSDLEIARLKKELGQNRTELASVRAAQTKELMTGLLPNEKSEKSQGLESERVALRSQLEKKVSFLEIDIAEIERNRLFKSVLAPQKNARGRVEFQTQVSEGDLLLTAECHRTSAVLRFRVVQK